MASPQPLFAIQHRIFSREREIRQQNQPFFLFEGTTPPPFFFPRYFLRAPRFLSSIREYLLQFRRSDFCSNEIFFIWYSCRYRLGNPFLITLAGGGSYFFFTTRFLSLSAAEVKDMFLSFFSSSCAGPTSFSPSQDLVLPLREAFGHRRPRLKSRSVNRSPPQLKRGLLVPPSTRPWVFSTIEA